MCVVLLIVFWVWISLWSDFRATYDHNKGMTAARWLVQWLSDLCVSSRYVIERRRPPLVNQVPTRSSLDFQTCHRSVYLPLLSVRAQPVNSGVMRRGGWHLMLWRRARVLVCSPEPTTALGCTLQVERDWAFHPAETVGRKQDEYAWQVTACSILHSDLCNVKNKLHVKYFFLQGLVRVFARQRC